MFPEQKIIDNSIKRLEKLVGDSFIDNQEEICYELTKLTHNNLALRYFLYSALKDAEKRNLVAAQSFMVHVSKLFYIRINLWYPLQGVAMTTLNDALENYFSVDLPHNHNYDFFTVGILGPGYVSDFLISSQETGCLRAGDTVSFDSEFRTKLSLGKSIFVPKDTHYHTQYAPEEFSVSLNLIPTVELFSRQIVLLKDRKTVDKVYLPPNPENGLTQIM